MSVAVVEWVKDFASRVCWHLNDRLIRHPGILSMLGFRLTVIDGFGAPGDTLLTAVVCRNLRERFPKLRINCITPNPDLLREDPNITTLNAPQTFFHLRSWYLDIINAKDGATNVLKPVFKKLGIASYDYHARVFLTEPERAAAASLLAGLPRPIVTINAASKEPVKNWPVAHWTALVGRLRGQATFVQLGDSSEPQLEGVTRFAGQLSMRESMAVLAHARVHIGPDSFLMHAANGLDVPSVIIFGGSRTPENLGYAGNANLATKPECSPCWIHNSQGEHCPYDIKCMSLITPETVYDAVRHLLSEEGRAVSRES